MCEDASRKRPAEIIEIQDGEASEPSETDKEEQLCAQAIEALNSFIRMYHISASSDMALNRIKISLYKMEQRRRRREYPVLADEVFHDAFQGMRVQTSELPVSPDRQVKRFVKVTLTNPTQTLVKPAVLLPKVPPLPTATMWTALSKNYDVEDEPTLKTFPHFGDDAVEDVVSEFYIVKQQRTSACEVEFIKEMCEYVLKYLQSTWNLQLTDLKRVAKVLKVEEKVFIEMEKNLRRSNRASKKKRRIEAKNAVKREKQVNRKADEQPHELNPTVQTISVTDYENLADSFRSLFCRRCFVYDCDYHGCVEPPKLSILEQNAVARSLKEKGTMMNRGRNCGNNCFLGQMSSTKGQDVSPPMIDSNKSTIILCARAYFICAGNFCEMAKIIGTKSCADVAEICAYYQINDRCLPKAPVPSKTRRSRKKNPRMSIAHILQNNDTDVVNSVPVKIEPCVHSGPCEAGVCSCVDNGLFCSGNCHCVHDECKIRFLGCQCQRGRCRTKACPCFCAARECDIDLCKLCSMDEIAACEKGERYPDDKMTKKEENPQQDTTCQNRSIALGKRKHVRMGRSELGAAGWGLFVDDFVAKDEFIIEYIGEMVTQEEADRRGAVYDKVERSYLFNLDTKTVIDSTRKGNKTRFINHSSKSPNCVCKIMNVKSDYRIGLYALTDLQPHTELVFDSNYDKQLYHTEQLKQPVMTDWMKDSYAPF